jgi:hypothetical protein
VVYAALSGLGAINEKVTIDFVVYDGVCPWVKISRVSDGIAIEMEVVTEKKPYLTLIPLQIYHLDLSNIYVQVHVNHVMAVHFHTQGLVFQKNIRNEAVIMIPQILFPFRTHPGATSIHPHPETKRGSI